jgi:hypothetical protein
MLLSTSLQYNLFLFKKHEELPSLGTHHWNLSLLKRRGVADCQATPSDYLNSRRIAASQHSNNRPVSGTEGTQINFDEFHGRIHKKIRWVSI